MVPNCCICTDPADTNTKHSADAVNQTHHRQHDIPHAESSPMLFTDVSQGNHTEKSSKSAFNAFSFMSSAPDSDNTVQPIGLLDVIRTPAFDRVWEVGAMGQVNCD